MEKKLDLEDTVRAVTEQPWTRIRAFMKPVIPALAAVLIAALAAGCTMMDSVPQLFKNLVYRNRRRVP